MKSVFRAWDWWIVLVFLFARLVLNVFNITELLFLFFSVAYLVLIILQIKGARVFSILLIMFLYIDSIIGTYLFTLSGNLGAEFYGTIFVNGAVIFLVLLNFGRKFR